MLSIVPGKYHDAISRLLARYDLNGECWEYKGARTMGGYGRMSYKGRCHDTHRIAFTEFVADIPNGMIVMHSCDNPPCFNPDHLYLGTQKDNMRDMTNKFRRASGKKLSDAIKAGWTDELRKEHSHRLIQARLDKRFKMAREAGVPLDWKYCPKCKQWKPMTEFGSNRSRPDGVNSYCTPCRY